jgi:antitoxin (DNA-binding transcriptional repressor) of toxin-antitoxin stability system
MRKVTVHEAKTHLSRLLRDIEAGEEIIICRGNVEIARLVAAGTSLRDVKEEASAIAGNDPKTQTPKQTAMGHLKGKIDPVTDDQLFEPVFTDEEWEAILDDDDLNLPPPPE